MFFNTHEFIPVPGKAEITIQFDADSASDDLAVDASGETVRLTKQGVGIKFTDIDMVKLQKCIINKMNQCELI